MRIAVGVAIAILLSLISTTGARAAGDPYTTAEQGYDISWPQCGDPPPPVGTFAIIGINGGAPFSANLCMTDQYAVAPRSAPPSLYLNTGYEDSYRLPGHVRLQAPGARGVGQQRGAPGVGDRLQRG